MEQPGRELRPDGMPAPQEGVTGLLVHHTVAERLFSSNTIEYTSFPELNINFEFLKD